MSWFFSIRTKLFGLVFTASLALIAILYWQIGAKAESVAEEAITRSLEQSAQILETSIDSRFRFIQELAIGIARDGRVLPLVAEQQSLTLQDLSKEYEAVYDFDILFFLDQNGTILARADNPDAVGVNLAGRTSLFDDPLAGLQSRGFFVSQGRLMQTAVAPIFDNIATDIVKGAVVMAYELSPDAAREILALTQSDIGFFVFTRDENLLVDGVSESFMTNDVLLSQVIKYFSNTREAWQSILDAPDENIRKTYLIDGEPYHSIYRRINGKDGNRLGFVAAIRSEQELKQPFKEIQHALLIAGGIGILFSSLFAGLMAMGVSSPIIRLVALIKQIQSGMYPEENQKISVHDEVGLLRNAVIQMGNGLREKAELESYLAGLADEVKTDTYIDFDGSIGAPEQPDLDQTRTMFNSSGSNPNIDDDKTVVSSGDQNKPKDLQGTYEIIDQRYQIISCLGSGAMGKVYLALDLELDEKIALKILDREVVSNVEGLNFKEEIRLARKITHRNIVRTFDFGARPDLFYITMEYVPGYDLGRLLTKKGALELNIGIAVSKQICSAMAAAHTLGIIHRDLKPSNMMINRQGILKIMDFGLAMQVSHSSDDHNSVDKEDQPGILGTPRYMAPEQFLARQLDERTDIYAIGIIMFTLFNGEPPFNSQDIIDLARQHSHSPIPEINRKNGENIPQGLTQIIRKALEKKPESRYQTVKDLLDDMNKL